MVKKIEKTVAVLLGSGGSALSVASSLTADGIMNHAKQEGWDVIDLASWHLTIPDRAKVDGVIYGSKIANREVLAPVLERIPFRIQLSGGNSDLQAQQVTHDPEAIGR